jgi:phytoene desaturase
MSTSAIYALIHTIEKEGGVWFAKGGTNRLVAAMVTHFERLGGTIRLDDAVEEIETRGDKVIGVRTKSGWRMDCDMAASNGDLMHSYQDLLKSNKRGERRRVLLQRSRSGSASWRDRHPCGGPRGRLALGGGDCRQSAGHAQQRNASCRQL